jgi:hypothetical protein
VAARPVSRRAAPGFDAAQPRLPVPTGLAKHELYAIPVGNYVGTMHDYLLDDIGFYVE